MKSFIFTVISVLVVFLSACNNSGKQPSSEAKQETMGGGESKNQTAIVVEPQNLATTNDVVCGMSMKTTAISDTAVVNGKVYPFCSAECKKSFMADMGKYKIN